MLPVSYDPALVVASILVAIMASFTGLRLASGLRELTPEQRSARIAKAAIALGGGIWSMHFVGMLAVRVSAQIEYDALSTLGSALVAILITGLALIILHSAPRTPQRIVMAGSLMGLGIVAMHYLGMSAIGGNCIVTYGPAGYLVSSTIAIVSSTCAVWLAYQDRAVGHIAIGSVVLGIAIAAMHYSAMVFTRFAPGVEIVPIADPALSSGVLALVVALATFLICGFFLLTALPIERVAPDPVSEAVAPAIDEAALAVVNGAASAPRNLPYERNNVIRFIPASNVLAVKAEGHYTRLYGEGGDYFCPWPISRVETHLDDALTFVRTHRSYLVNVNHIKGFQRSGDRAVCIVNDERGWEVPVSRTKIPEIKQALGLD